MACSSAKTHSQAERPPIFQPVSSTCWTGAVPGRLDQPVVAGLGQPPQAMAAADQGRRGDDQPGEGQQHRGALAVGDAEAMLQVGGEAQQPRPVLDGGGPQGVGGLLGVAALDAAAAGRAASHRDAEAGDDRLGLGQVDLVLVVDGDRGVVQRGVTLRALRRQRDLDGAIDLLRRRGRSMAGRMPGLAPRPLGVGLGRPLGEGGGLPLARPAGLLQLGLEPFHLGAQLVDLAGLTPGQVEEFVVGGGLASMTGVLHDQTRRTLQGSGQRPGNQVRDPLPEAPHAIRQASSHRRGAGSPVTLLAGDSQRPHTPAEVVAVPDEVRRRVVQFDLLGEAVGLAMLAAVLMPIRPVVPLDEGCVDRRAHRRASSGTRAAAPASRRPTSAPPRRHAPSPAASARSRSTGPAAGPFSAWAAVPAPGVSAAVGRCRRPP